MGKFKTFIAVFLATTLAPVHVLAAGAVAKIPNDTIQFGKSGSVLQKNLMFDFGLGAFNPQLGADSSNVFHLNKNQLNLGDALSSTKTIVFDLGLGSANPKINFDPSASSLQFSNDGVNFTPIGTGGGGASVELLQNAGFESGVTQGWSNTGGTFAAVNSGSNLLVGRGSATFQASATGQFFQSTLYSIPNGLTSQNCAASIMYKGGDGSQTFEVVDGSSNVLASQVLSAVTVATVVPLTFVCPSSGSLRLKVLSSVSGALYAYDQAHLGSNDLINLSQARWVGNVTYSGAFTSSTIGSTSPTDLTISGATVASSGAVSPATGSLIGVNLATMQPGTYQFVSNIPLACDGAGTPDNCQFALSSTTASYSNGNGLIIMNPQNASGMSPFVQSVVVTNSLGAQTFRVVANSVSHAGTGIFVAGGATTLTVDVYYYPSSGNTAVNAGNSAVSWSGSLTGATSTSSAVEADFGGTSSVGTVYSNLNIGTVTGGSGLSLSFNPSVAGRWKFCAWGDMLHNATGTDTLWITDGSNNHLSAPVGTTTNQASWPFNICGVANITSTTSPFTVKIRGATGASTITPDNTTFSIENLDQGRGAPVLVGSVGSSSGSVEKVNRISVSMCTSDPCTSLTQSGNWVTAVNRTGTGSYTVHISTGVFSGMPACTINNDSNGRFAGVGSVTATSFNVSTETLTLTAEDDPFSIICMGPH